VNGISSAVLGLLGGAAFGALLTGYFTIRQKAVARVQKRRVAVYIDMLAWIGTRLPEHVPYSKAIDTDKNVTVPDPAATDPDTKQTDPDTRFFVTLRARVAAFGSHDMARAFDRWTAAYRMVVQDPEPGCTNHSDQGEPKFHNQIRSKPDCKRSAQRALWSVPTHAVIPWRRRALKMLAPERIGFVLCRKIDSGHPDRDQGCLTKAIEFCASKELRKG
jgi:hypothetical protein